MRTIGYISWKGGVGKTLLSFNTLERAAASGLKALGCDFDPQKMLAKQNAIRLEAEVNPQLSIVQADLTVDTIDTLERVKAEAEYDLVVCDMPGADNLLTDRALNVMDAILIPVNGVHLEMMNTVELIDRAKSKGWEAYLIRNNMPPYRQRNAMAEEDLAEMDAPVAPVTLVRRVTHWDAGAAGMTVCEHAPSSPAASEVREYWAWLQGALKITRNVTDQKAKRNREVKHDHEKAA